ncbi:MAG: nitrite/sulfite reductase [Actinomycetota bacterium]|nr:nitrite/sulfite reductase [Actinomycetota bacterium]
MPPDIPGVKRAGLPVDLERLAAEGDQWLTPEDRYALKTHGVCAQAQDDVFMVRIRIPGGVVLTDQVRGLARIAKARAADWLHISTRQNVELHWVRSADVPTVLDQVARLGLSTRSACGHTLRNVMASEDAGLGLDEPFDCLPDARLVSDVVVARSAELNCVLPSRINMAFGGSPRCHHDALVNDAGFVSVVVDGKAGYELWGGGSLGKAPCLAVKLCDFVPREEVLAASEALIDVFVQHGDFDSPAKGRMKFVLEDLGEEGFRTAWQQAFAEARTRPHPAVPDVPLVDPEEVADILAHAPAGGWSVGVRPQRTAGLALVTVDAPMGDLTSAEAALVADLADRLADGALTLSRDQNAVFRNVAIARIPELRESLAAAGLHLLGESPVAHIRACTGSAVCALGITTAPDAGVDLLSSPALARNSSLRVHLSGCPNSCAQHQIGDIGLAGSKVRVNGETKDGYQVFVGADLDNHTAGVVIGRVAAEDVPAAVDAVVGTWEAMRHGNESLGRTALRLGTDAFAAHIESVMHERWAADADPDAEELTAALP